MIFKHAKFFAVILAVLVLFASPGVSYAKSMPQTAVAASLDAPAQSIAQSATQEPQTEVRQAQAATQQMQTTAASVLKLQFQSTLAKVKKLTAGRNYVTDEALIEVSTAMEAAAEAKKIGAAVKYFSPHGYAVLKLGSGQTLVSVLTQNAKTAVLSKPLYPNAISYTAESINDPKMSLQYCHNDMGNKSAWNISKGSSKLVVAVLDTGIDTDHPEFSKRISSLSYNSYSKQKGIQYVNDDCGHGTHVAGIIAAAQNNKKGGSGTAPNVQIMAIKANLPGSSYFNVDAQVNGIYYAADHGAKVLNMSIERRYYQGENYFEHKAIQYAVSKGVVVVCAAGNDKDPHAGYPAAYPECIAVSATNSGNKFASRYSNYGSEVDISAPGTDIYSTYPDKAYGYMSGTSMASPQVAGVVALIRSYYPKYSVSQVRAKLLETAADKGTPGYDIYYGNGAVNSYHALMQYTVKFNSKGGSSVSSKKGGYNGLISAPASPKKSKYHFGGWYRDSTCKTAWVFASSRVRGNITLYARWISNNLTVKFNAQGGTAVSAKAVIYGRTISAPKTPTRSGYTFGGWYKDAACTVAWNFASGKVMDNITLYAKWILKTFNVTFNSQGGSAVPAVAVKQYSIFTAPAAPALYGYVFMGWYKEAACINAWNFAADKVNTNITLYAKWAAQTFTVTFDNTGGTAVPSVTGTYNQMIPAPAKPTWEGYSFGGWYKESSCTNAWDFSTDKVTGNITLYAKWTAQEPG